MEVPLATLVIAGAVAAAVRGRAAFIAIVAAVAFISRPETVAFAGVFPVLLWARTRPRLAFGLGAAAVGGGVLSLCLSGIRNEIVSGRWLPATFYAKVSTSAPIDLRWQAAGFLDLMGQLPLVEFPVFIAALAVVSVALLGRRATTPAGRIGAALYLSGMAFCAVSFALVHPVDPAAFYHQRYVLPALLPIVPALPLLAHEIVGRLEARAGALGRVALAVIIAVVLVYATPSRYRRLANDAQNIDDVQVAFGRALSGAAASENAWVVDAGASRFFGSPFVVDLIGLNTPELLTAQAQSFLDGHPPRYLDVFPGWSQVEADGAIVMPARSFAASTIYTVTSFSPMRQHLLLSCEPPGTSGRLTIRGRAFTFRCAR
jgi:hypothetical protein